VAEPRRGAGCALAALKHPGAESYLFTPSHGAKGLLSLRHWVGTAAAAGGGGGVQGQDGLAWWCGLLVMSAVHHTTSAGPGADSSGQRRVGPAGAHQLCFSWVARVATVMRGDGGRSACRVTGCVCVCCRCRGHAFPLPWHQLLSTCWQWCVLTVRPRPAAGRSSCLMR